MLRLRPTKHAPEYLAQDWREGCRWVLRPRPIKHAPEHLHQTNVGTSAAVGCRGSGQQSMPRSVPTSGAARRAGDDHALQGFIHISIIRHCNLSKSLGKALRGQGTIHRHLPIGSFLTSIFASLHEAFASLAFMHASCPPAP